MTSCASYISIHTQNAQAHRSLICGGGGQCQQLGGTNGSTGSTHDVRHEAWFGPQPFERERSRAPFVGILKSYSAATTGDDQFGGAQPIVPVVLVSYTHCILVYYTILY